jgi:hypothetical protein
MDGDLSKRIGGEGEDMAIYNLEVPYFIVRNPRSGGLFHDEDTLFASTGLVVNNAQGGLHHDWGAQTMALGDRGKGSIVATGLRWAGVDVPDPTSENPDGGSIHWTFLLINAGQTDIGFIPALNNLSEAFAGALASNTINGQAAGDAGTDVLGFLANANLAFVPPLLNLLVANCDGDVVNKKAPMQFTAKDLANMTAANGFWETRENNPGTNSPAGCGSNSNYDVAYGISSQGAALPWSGEEDLGGVLTSSPAVASWGLNRLDCFYRGQNNHMWHRSWGGNGWTNEDDRGGVLTSGPAVASWGPNRLDCFYRGQNNHMWHRWYDGGWSDEEDLGGVLTSGPAVASRGPNLLDCFYRGQNNHMLHRWWDGNAWSGEEDLGGILTSDPAVASRGFSHLDCFYKGQNNHMLHRWWDGSGWSGEEDLGGILTSSPAVASWGPNQLDCFYVGQNDHMLHRWWDGRGWSGEEDLGGAIITSSPAAAAWGPNRLDCFYIGAGNHMWHRWFPAWS